MGASGLMNTSNTYIKYWLECSLVSQSIANNTSGVTVKVYIKRTNTGYTTCGNGTCHLTINGTAFSQAITTSQVISSTPICIMTVSNMTIPHNADGTKTLTMSSYISHDVFSSSSQSYSEGLPTIARTSTFTLTSGSSIECGGTITAGIARATSTFTHKAYIKFGSEDYVLIGEGIGTSFSYTVPMSWCSKMPNSSSGTLTIELDTYSGSTYIGHAYQTCTVYVPSSVVPTLSSLGIARVDANGVPAAWAMYVQGKSQATLTINGASGSYGSWITSYSIWGAGYSSGASSFTTGTLNTAGTNYFYACITDSRGRTSTTLSTNCVVVPYTSPSITSFSGTRCISAGTFSDSGTYIKALTDFSYSPCSNGTVNKNSFTAGVQYRQAGPTTWSTSVAIASGATGVIIGGGAINIDYSYEVLLTVADYFTSATYSVIVGTSATIIDFKKGGKGIAIGKVSETDNLLDIAWDLQVNGAKLVEQRYLSGINLNDYRYKSGIYGIYNYYDGAKWVANISTLEVLYYSNDWVVQRVTEIANGQSVVWQRTFTSGTTWNGWVQTGSVLSSSTVNGNIFATGNIHSSGIINSAGMTVYGTNVAESGATDGNQRKWTRFYDGTQICYMNISFTINTSSQAGAIWYKGDYWGFPVAFINAPVVTVSFATSGVIWAGATSQTTTTIAGVMFYSFANVTYTGSVQIVAVGRWY